jgi:hypothetical protein
MCEGTTACGACADRAKMERSKSLCHEGDGPSAGCPAPIQITSGKDLTDRLTRGGRRRPTGVKSLRPGRVYARLRAKADGRDLGTIELMPWGIEGAAGDAARRRGDEEGARQHYVKAQFLHDSEARRQRAGLRSMAERVLDNEHVRVKREAAGLRRRARIAADARRKAERYAHQIRLTEAELGG